MHFTGDQIHLSTEERRLLLLATDDVKFGVKEAVDLFDVAEAAHEVYFEGQYKRAGQLIAQNDVWIEAIPLDPIYDQHATDSAAVMRLMSCLSRLAPTQYANYELMPMVSVT